MTISYDPADSSSPIGLLQLLFRWHGTMLPLVFHRATFWLLISFHFTFLCREKFAVDLDIMRESLPEVDASTVKEVTALLTFFIVFYSSQCYARFQFFWSQVIGLGNVCMEWTTLVAVYLPDDPTVRWNCTRFLLASMHILFFMVNSHKDEGEGRVIDDDHHESSLISEAEWRMLLQRYLLTPEECSIINEYKGLASGLPITWALAEVEAVFSSVSPANMQDKRSPPERASILASFRALAFRMRNHCREIKQTLQMPVPFPYFQFLTLLLGIDLVLVSYTIITLDYQWQLSMIIYVVIVTAFLGLKEVAVAMADPFGEDDVDFDVDSLLQDAYKDTLAALRDTRAPLGNTATTRTNPLDAAQPTPAKVRTFSDSPANMEAPAEESPWWVAMWRVPWAAPKKASREIL